MADSAIPLSDCIEVGRRFLRSVNLEKDFGNGGQNGEYIVTPTGRRVLHQLTEGLEDRSPYRAWTITGPYGVGKSAFGVFVTRLFCSSNGSGASALRKLAETDPARAHELERFRRVGGGQKLLYPLLITARRAPASVCLLEGVLSSAKKARGQAAVELASKTTSLLRSATKGAVPDSREVASCVAALSDLMVRKGHAGLLVLIDELGKLFEYAAYRPHRGDVFVLQELAEHASRSGHVPMLIVGFLHQSFEEYGRQLDSVSRNEWAKIQGRFQDVAFLEPSEQVLRMIGAAVKWRSGGMPPALQRRVKESADRALRSGICPPAMRHEEFGQVCLQAYPLHPAALVALPHLFHRFAQNERSLFSYLSSQEPNAFQSFLRTKTLDTANVPYIRLGDLFDYFGTSFGSGLYRQPQARRWLEAADVLDRNDKLEPFQIGLVKAIGVLSTLGTFSNLSATRTQISFAATDQTESELVDKALESLTSRSILTFRRFNETFRIWEGSDVDVEERIAEGQRRTRADLRLAPAIERYLPPRPIVARRHSFEVGTLRFFQIRYVDDPADLPVQLTSKVPTAGTIYVALSTSAAQLDAMRGAASAITRPDCLLAIPQEIGELRAAVSELISLQWAWENTPELRDDRVARRELAMRISDAQQLLHKTLSRLLDPRGEPLGSGCAWYWRGEKRKLRLPVEVAHLLSDVCDELYSKCPRIHNELIARRAVSSAAAAARRNLVERMLANAAADTLGIEGYPPERSMYESVLRATGLHRLGADGKHCIGPPPKRDPSRLLPVWRKLEALIFRDDPEPAPLPEVFSAIGQPPFGVPDGLHPVFLCAFLCANSAEVTLYREGTFIPEPAVTDFEVLMRRPELFAVAGSRLTGGRAAVVQRIAKGLSVEPATVPVVRALFRIAKSLPEHARSTMKLSPLTIAMRQAFSGARSPERFLFNELPKSLDLQVFAGGRLDRASLDDFFSRLNRGLQEWGNATTRMIEQARDILIRECGFATGADGWQSLRSVARRLEPSVTNPHLQPFVRRLTQTDEGDRGVDAVLALLANRPPALWSDLDVERFPSVAQLIGSQFRALSDSHAVSSPGASLAPADRRLAEAVASRLEKHLSSSDRRVPIHILREALLTLARRIAPDT